MGRGGGGHRFFLRLRAPEDERHGLRQAGERVHGGVRKGLPAEAAMAVRMACADAVNRQPVLSGSAITDNCLEHDHDRFHAAHPDTHWQYAIAHAEKIALGSGQYELVQL